MVGIYVKKEDIPIYHKEFGTYFKIITKEVVGE